VSRPRWEDGTSGRPLGDDEDFNRSYVADLGPDPSEHWDEMDAAERRAVARGAGTTGATS